MQDAAPAILVLDRSERQTAVMQLADNSAQVKFWVFGGICG
jgi:hypothetical protein